MSKGFGKRAVTVMLGATLLGGVFVTVPSELTMTQAQAASKISYAQYMSDINGIRAALGKASSDTQSDVADNLPTATSSHPYDAEYYGINAYLGGLASSVNDCSRTKATAQANYDCIVATYKVFKSRLSSGAQSQLESLASNMSQEIDASNSSTNFYSIRQHEDGYVRALASAVLDYGGNYDGVAAKPKAKKGTITKLAAKKTASKKYVKITGTAKLYKKANYAHIKTYKGYRYAKLSSKHTFSKTIYAPKAKTVKVTVGYYANGHYTAVTAAKTARVK